MARDARAKSVRLTPEAVMDIMRETMRLRPSWSLIALGAAFLSAFSVSWKDGTASVTFDITAVSAVLVALVWLPALLAVVAWTGGSVKTPAGEATSGGFVGLLEKLPVTVQSEVLGNAAAILESAEQGSQGDDRVRASVALGAVREGMVDALAKAQAPVGRRLDELAQAYDDLRSRMPSGPLRTRQMSALVEQAIAYVRADVAAIAFLARWLQDFPRFNNGQRVMAMAALRALPLAVGLEATIDCLLHSRSPYEQYQAVRAAEGLAAKVHDEARVQLHQALSDALAGVGTIPLRGSDREELALEVLRLLSRPGTN